jgi:formate hydrogenlyase subunit 6/NADH:ubiquinone oxidoreductase subunit I
MTEMYTVCDGCGSKIYLGDTVYRIDRQVFCEDCVEVCEFEAAFDSDLYKFGFQVRNDAFAL